MAVVTDSIRCRTSGDGDTVDLSDGLRGCLTASGLTAGVATLFIGGSTAGLTTLEYEPGVVADLDEVLESIAPRERDWKHHQRWGDHNGHSHVRAALIGPSLAVPFVSGKLALGTWQQVVIIDFDETPRDREVLVQLIGD